MWELLVFSVPVFYIIGLISFIRFITKGKSVSLNDRVKVLEEVLSDLKRVTDLRDVKLLIGKYGATIQQSRVSDSTSPETPQEVREVTASLHEPEVKQTAKPEKPAPPPIDLGKVWANWYSNNSINLLLYIGAFLIVASASIYVGFQWGSIASSFKAFFFTFITLLFLICGLIFYRIKLIKSAGFTFISIAAILVPFNGVAWYNFYFSTQGVEPGSVWLVTSIISIIIYIFLAYYLKKSAFTYISSVGVLSLVLSVVNVSHLAMEFYVLGGVFAAFLFLFSGRIGQKNTEVLLQEPLSISAQVTLPLSLVFGLYFALDKGLVLSYPTAISLFLSSAFYLISYTFDKKIWYLVGTQLLLPAAVYIFLRSSQIPISQALIMVQAVPFIYLPIRRFIQDKEEISLNATNILAGGLGLAAALMNASTFSFYSIGVALALGILSLHFLVAYFVERRSYYITFASAVYPIALFCFLRWVGIEAAFVFMVLQILSMIYLGVSFLLKDYKEEQSQILYIARILMPAAGIMGAILSVSAGHYFGNVSLFSLLAFTFYALCFLYTRGKTFFIAAGVLFPISVYFIARFTGLPLLTSLNIVQTIGLFYMGASVYAKKNYKEGYEVVQNLANIILPSVAFGVSLSAWYLSQTIFVPQVVFSVFTGVIYYALSYYITRNKAYFLLAEIVFLWFVFVASKWMGADMFIAFIAVDVACVFCMGVGYILRDSLGEESNLSVGLSVLASSILSVISFALFGLDTYKMFYLSLFPFVYSVAAYVYNRYIGYFYVQLFFEITTVYFLVFQILPFGYKYETLGLIYVGIGSLYYSLISAFSKDKKIHDALITATGVNSVLALIVTLGTPKIAGVISFIIVGLLFHYQLKYKKPYGVYIGSIIAVMGIYFELLGWHVPSYLHPFVYQAFFLLLYGCYCILNNKDYAFLRVAGLAGSFATVLYFFFISIGVKDVEMSSLITAYILTIQFAFDAWFVREKYFGYIASGIGMLTYFWQIHFLGYTEYQIYLLPLGLYFLALSFLTRNEKTQDVPVGLEYGGLFILLVPLLFQCFGKNGTQYSFLLALEGAGLLVPGITLQKKSYTYAGVAAIMSAVFSQTYTYVFGLPRWVITAVGGLTFIVVAIFLLLKRKDTEGGK